MIGRAFGHSLGLIEIDAPQAQTQQQEPEQILHRSTSPTLSWDLIRDFEKRKV
jgi:hypothetical protein